MERIGGEIYWPITELKISTLQQWSEVFNHYDWSIYGLFFSAQFCGSKSAHLMYEITGCVIHYKNSYQLPS